MVTKKPLWLLGMVDGAQELLKFGRAHDAPLVVLALHDRQQVLAAEAQVGAFVAGAAGLLDLVAQRLEQLGHELLECLGRQRGSWASLSSARAPGCAAARNARDPSRMA